MEKNSYNHSTVKFLKSLYDRCEGGYINVRLLPSAKNLFIPLSKIDSIPSTLQTYKNQNVYFGVATHIDGDATKEGIIQIPALFIDIDLDKFSEDEKKAILQRLKDFPLPSSFEINSGGGIHVYWKFKEPLSKKEINQVENINRALASYFNGDPGTTDASRILRIPGTFNRKYSPPREVMINGFYPEREYDFDDFDQILPSIQESFDQEKFYPIENERQLIRIQLNRIMECEFLKHCDKDRITLSEPEWYAMISILARERGGPKLIHRLSIGYPKYSREETDKKIIHAINDAGPAICERIKDLWDCGKDCGVRSPMTLALRAKQNGIETYDDGALRYEPEKTTLQIETLGDLLKKDLVPRDFIIGDGLISRKDLVIFSGPQKKGKSLTSLNLAISIAHQTSWLGFDIPSLRRVGIIQQEIPEESLKDRLEKMLKNIEGRDFLDKIPQLTCRGLKLDSKEGIERIFRWLDMAKIDLLILDPLYLFHNKRENDTGDMGRICETIQNIAQKYNCGILVIHHHGKPSQVEREGGDLHRGSSVLRDATDGNWTFTRVPQNKYELEGLPSQYVLLSFEQRHILSPDPILIRLNPETLWFEQVDARSKGEIKIEEVVNCLSEHAGEMLQEDLILELMNRLKLGEWVCRQGIYKVRDAGKIIAAKEEGGRHRRVWKMVGVPTT